MNCKLLSPFLLALLLSVDLAIPWGHCHADDLRDIEYAKVGELSLNLDLYLPKQAAEQPPLIVWIHGGGWKNGSKDRCPFSWLTQHGFAVASVQYRLSDQATFPAQIHDCKGAIRFLRANAEKYGYSAERIGAVGISAGGHLVALLGTSGEIPELEGEVGGNLDQSSRVQAVLDMCGPSDFLLILQQSPLAASSRRSSVGLLLGGSIKEEQELAELASPVTHVSKDDPPLLIFHGTKDPLVHPRQSERLRDAYQEAGLTVQLDLIEGGGHVPGAFWDAKHRTLAVELFQKHLRTSAGE